VPGYVVLLVTNVLGQICGYRSFQQHDVLRIFLSLSSDFHELVVYGHLFSGAGKHALAFY